MKEKVNRSKMVHVRLTQDEYQKLQQRFQKTTCRKFSEYLRHCLFDKSVTTTYRNTSLDDFMIEMSALKKELNHIGNNYNQAVKKLHTLWRIEEFRKWITINERDKIILFVKIDAIEHHLKKMTKVWLR